MLHFEEDIDFSLLSDTLLEELCYDLLVRRGFQSLSWRQGPHDKGRDIEGEFEALNPLVGRYTERWFFECKHHSRGVGKSELSSATEWADVEKPDHLVLLVVPHITNQCREWLDEKRKRTSYRIHTLEGKQLKNLILQYDELIGRYFLNKVQRLFRNAFVDWVAAGIFPDSERLSIFYRAISPELLTGEEMAFIMTAQIEGGFKVRTTIDAEGGEARETFITQVIQRMYSLAQTAKSYIWDEHKIKLQKTHSLIHTEVPFQWRRLRTTSLVTSYDRDGVSYKGHYHLIFNDQSITLEILLGQAVSTNNLVTDIRLVQCSQDVPEVVTQLEEERNRARSELVLSSATEGRV
jgi:hypothetical protein